jgi:hypothetical protein
MSEYAGPGAIAALIVFVLALFLGKVRSFGVAAGPKGTAEKPRAIEHSIQAEEKPVQVAREALERTAAEKVAAVKTAAASGKLASAVNARSRAKSKKGKARKP